MKYEEFRALVRHLKSIYTLRTFLEESTALQSWWDAFKGVEKDRFEKALQEYIKSSTTPPTPADIFALMENPAEKEPTWKKMNLWGLYKPDGEIENVTYAHPSMSNVDVLEWFRRSGEYFGYEVHIIERAAV